MSDLEGTMRRIAGLIAKADHPATDPVEAAAFRGKAEELLRKYRLEEEDVIAGEVGSVEPVYRQADIAALSSEFKHYHTLMWAYVAKHTGVLFVTRYESDRQGYVAHVVGYDVDIRMAEILFNSARLMMIAKLEPEVDAKLSDKQNIYRLRSAGIDRQRIAEMVWGKRGHQEGLRVGRLYQEACADRGEDAVVSGRSVNAATYRAVYAREFVMHFATRLQQARDAADSVGGTLVLSGRYERVQEAFWTRFPDLRPKPAEEQPTATTTSPTRKGRQRKAVTKADEAYWDRMYYSATARRASAAGRAAADAVSLERVQGAKRVTDTRRPVGELED
jgi:hypothetical protein